MYDFRRHLTTLCASVSWALVFVPATARVDAIVDAFASALEWGERSTRAINLTTQAASALAAIAQQLPDELAPTVFQIPTLLSDASWRRAALPFLPQASRAFWTDRFPLLASDAITPLTNMVDRLRASTSIAVLLGQSRSTYRIREAMDRRQIVLVCTGTGGPRDRVGSNLLVFDLFHGARGRADLAAAERALFWPFFDEVQSYDGGASDTLAALTEQLAKFGVRAAFLSQNPERLNPATLTALLTNRSHMLSSALNARAAALLAREWPAGVGEAALTNLERFHFIAQVTDRGRSSAPFALRGIRLEDVFDLDEFPAAPQPVAGEAGTTAADTLEHLETLDERIKAALLRGASGRSTRRGESGPASGPVSFKRSRPE